jgi:hypothetical protein
LMGCLKGVGERCLLEWDQCERECRPLSGGCPTGREPPSPPR